MSLENSPESSSAPHALVSQDGHVLTVTLNRPEARNALSTEMLSILGETWDRVNSDDSVRAVILTGAGGYFCAGADLKAMSRKAPSESFESGEYDQVELVYTQFLSVGVQRVANRRFMPLESTTLESAAAGPSADYEFEPDPALILERLLPRYAEARLFAAMLDASASEHASRQRAMKSATDNAEDLIVRLSRVMNRARQDSITTEIMEIISGAESLAQGEGSPDDLLLDKVGAYDFFAHPHAPHAHTHTAGASS